VPSEHTANVRYKDFSSFTEGQANAIRTLFAHMSELTNLKFVEVPFPGNTVNMISFSNYGEPVSMGVPRRGPTESDGRSFIIDGEMFIQPLTTLGRGYSHPLATLPGGIMFELLTHELGHILGLSHPGDYGAGPGGGGPPRYETHATHFQDSRQYTVCPISTSCSQERTSTRTTSLGCCSSP
jgi:serralysin